MGALLSTRQHDGIEEIDIGPNHVYRYPPRSGEIINYITVIVRITPIFQVIILEVTS